MKHLNVRVSDSEIIINNDNSNLVADDPFYCDFCEQQCNHNCPLEQTEIDHSNSMIDDIIAQQFPDDHICAHCGCITFEDCEIVVGGLVFCDDFCLIRFED